MGATMHNKKRRGLMMDFQYGGAIDRRLERLQKRQQRLEERGKTDSKRYGRLDDRIADIQAGGLGKTGFGNAIVDVAGGIGEGISSVAPILKYIPGVGQIISPIAQATGDALGRVNDKRQALGQGRFGTGLGNVFGGGMYGLSQNQGFGGGQPQQQQGQPMAFQGAGSFGGFQGLGQLPFGDIFGSEFMGSPGFAGGTFGGGQQPQFGGGMTGGFSDPFQSLQSIFSLFSSLGNLQRGGTVKKYQQGGLVDIQAEKGEYIFHPTQYITPVHAKRSHKAMERSHDEDLTTDHPLDQSFIFSDYIKIKKSDADDMIVGVKRYPYEEGKKGKEPEVFSVGDLFRKNEKGKTPAKLADRLTKIFKVSGDKNDIFNVLGDQLNLKNRLAYVEGIATLSEIERERSDMEDAVQEIERAAGLRKGGRAKRRTHYQYGGISYDSFANLGNDINSSYSNPLWGDIPVQYGRPIIPGVPQIPGIDFGSLFGNPMAGPNSNLGNFPGYSTPINPLPGAQYGPVTSNNPNAGSPPPISSSFDTRDSLASLSAALNSMGGQTQFVNTGDQQLQNLGRTLIPIGGAINTAANGLGAAGSFMLYNNLVNENKDFFEGQRGLAGQARDVASFGNMFDIGLNFLQQGPEDLPENDATRLRNFNPYRAVNIQRSLADQTLGEINSLIRGSDNANIRAINLGNAIASNNQAIGNAEINALNQQFQIDQQLDNIDFQNKNINVGNQQRRNDFGNSLIQGARPSFGALFTNEASRPLDTLALNTAERENDINFRQQRLYQPVQYLSSMGNSLSNLGSSAYAMGQQYTPVQTQQGQGFNLDTILSLGNILSSLGLGKGK